MRWLTKLATILTKSNKAHSLLSILMRATQFDIIGKDARKPYGYATGHKGFNTKKRGHNKYICGPRSLTCPCCSVGDPTDIKPFIRRIERRKAKLDLRKELEAELE